MSWWRRLRRRSQMEEELEKELHFHINQRTAEFMARGENSVEARRRALLALGGLEQAKEECRDARGTRWLEDLLQDLRFAVRTLAQKPGFAAVILLTLALGTGATTVLFTVIHGVLLKPLPYADPGRLVAVQEETEKATQYGNIWAFAYLNYLDCRRASRALDLAAWRYSGGTVNRNGEAEYVDGFQISSGLFSTLGVSVLRGRAFLPEEDIRGAAPVMIISYRLWQRLYGGNSAAMGMSTVFDGRTYTVVGIAPLGFRLNGDEGDVFTPIGQDTSASMQNRSRHPGINVLGRLQPHETLAQARTELGLIGRHLAKQYPSSNEGRAFVPQPLRPKVGDVASTLWLLFGAVSLVLLIACANVANLLLVRAVSREREFAMRAALGAGRGRLVRQCLTESAVLGLSGGALGVALAAAAIRPFITFWPGSLPRAEEVFLDWHVLLFALGISVLSGVVFGLAPALRIPNRNLEKVLRAGGRTDAVHPRHLHYGFVVTEIALAVVLLVSAGILGRTLLRLSALNAGVNIHNVLVTRMALSPGTLTNPAAIRATWQQVIQDARSVPGVQSVATVDTVPLRDGNNQVGYSTSPSIMPAPNQTPLALATSVTPDYFAVMGIPLLKGRFFDDHDRVGNEPVVVIDEVLAQQAFGIQEPVGKRLWMVPGASPFSSDSQVADAVRVVGVVGHVRHWGVASDDQAGVRAQFYYAFAQVPDGLLRRWSELMSIAVRTSIPPENVLAPLRRAVRGAAGDQVLYQIRTMEELSSASLARQRFLLLLFGISAGLALLLACVGIYGVLAYLTSRRVPEIGLRMALGANTGEVVWLVLRQSMTITFSGVAVGVVGAFITARLLESSVAGVQSIEPFTFAMMIATLVVAAAVASYVPARRATYVDPMSALRQE